LGEAGVGSRVESSEGMEGVMARAKNQPTTLLTDRDLASICEVDLKTVHNWVAKGDKGPPHFRTPGRHLRFKPEEIVPWLRHYGYTIPEHLKQYLPAQPEKAVEA